MKIIDVNAGLGFWPIQRFTHSSLHDLECLYDRNGVDEVWVSAIESVLYPEPDTFDKRLLNALPPFPRFRAVKTVNPLLGNWEPSLRAVAANHDLAAVKIFPNYHGYSASKEQLASLCAVATELKVPILLPLRLNDTRNQPVAMQVQDVPAEDVAQLSLACPETLLIGLNSYRHELSTLARGSANLLADIAYLDGENTLAQAMDHFPPERLIFGSGEAFLHLEAAILKIEHASLPEHLRQDICSQTLIQHLPK